MKLIRACFDSPWKINLLLLAGSFSIYLFYFHTVFLNLNSILSSITGDALKNYYTYSYHIRNDEHMLHFSGMNFPFGEHVVFTDCQPILTFILRLMPFTHDYLIGILHALLFASYIITPLILNRIFRRLEIDPFTSFFASLAITLLSPQFARINGGHHALAYGFIVPLAILLVLNFIKRNSTGNLLKLLLYNFILFLLHPYLGFSTSFFCFLTLLLYLLFTAERKTFLKRGFQVVLAGLVPIAVFRLFMQLSDRHAGRTVEPHGSKTLIENTDSLLAPDFGPFQHFMESLFPNKIGHLEGHSYLGSFTILLLLLLILSAPFLFKKFRVKKEMSAILLSSFLLLLLSFGLHTKLMDLLQIKSGSLNQFRASCRFAWFFYYALPLFMLPLLYHAFKANEVLSRSGYILPLLIILLFGLNLWEANSFFRKDEANFWKFRNLLNEKYLNAEEKEIIRHIAASRIQAILPLPIFAIGSEMYDRIGADYSMIPSMLYSYHSGVPILSGCMSRTSINETEAFIQVLNSYKKDNPVLDHLSAASLLVIKTKDPLMADEERLLNAVKMFRRNDTLEFGEINKAGLKQRKLDERILYTGKHGDADSNGIVYVPFANRKPYLWSRMQDYETIYTLDSNKLSSGNYIVSFHYHYTRKVYTSLNNTLIINKIGGASPGWAYYQHLSLFSGFYPGFSVFEYKISLEKNSRYEFMLKGDEELNYKISHFMLRPGQTSVIVPGNRDSLFNNFPD